MFAAPPDIPASLFARLPDPLREADETHPWVAAQPRGGPSRSLLEGPAFDREGMLWCVDLPNGRILRVSPEGDFHVVKTYDGWPNGLAIHRDGRVFIADHKRGILILDPVSGRMETFLERFGVEPFKGVNDLTFASNGDLYFTDQGLTGWQDPSGRLFRHRAAGDRLECLLEGIPSPNGLVLTRDESAVLLAVTRANAVWRVPLTRQGPVKVGTFIQLSGGGGPDGLALDAEGGLAVAHVGMGSVWLFDARGEPRGRIRSPLGAYTTNLAYGGAGNASLFITESESAVILRAEPGIPGAPLFSHAPAED